MLTRLSTSMLAAALLAGGAWALAQTKPDAKPAEQPAAKPAPKPPAPKPGVPSVGPAVRFLHEHHSGAVAVPGKAGQTRDLTCRTCHAVSVEQPLPNRFPGPDLVKYPETAKLASTGDKVNRIGFPKSHSACIECHSKEIRPGSTQMCGMCHATIAKLRPFPNPDIELSQFADRFSHKAHKDYLDNTPDPSKVTASHPSTDVLFVRAGFPVQAKPAAPAAAPVEKGLRCRECHTADARGVKMQQPDHGNCFACHAKTKIVAATADTFWSNCSGCHANMEANRPTVDPALKPPKDAANSVSPPIPPFRYVVTPTGPRNPAFRHASHASFTPESGKGAGKALEGKAACLFCHTSAERAGNRVQMKAFAIRKTDPQLTQPPATACVVCHVHAVQMTVPKPGKTDQCLACHTRADAAKPPPANHAPAAEAKPAEAKPAETPAPAKPAAPEAKPPAAQPAPDTKPPSAREARFLP